MASIAPLMLPSSGITAIKKAVARIAGQWDACSTCAWMIQRLDQSLPEKD